MSNRAAYGFALVILSSVFTTSMIAWQAPAGGGQPGAAAPGQGQRGAAQAPTGERGAAPGQRGGGQAAGRGPRVQDGALPPGAPHPDPLPVDVFTTKNFYKDKALWSDP